MAKQKTHEEFVKQLAEKFPWLRVLSFYVNSKTKVKVEDTRCGHVWEAFPTDLLGGHGCPYCGFKRTAKSHIVPLKIMLEKLGEAWNGLIVYVSGYEGMSTPCIWLCVLDGHTWKTTPDNIINKKTGCPLCANMRLSKLFTTSESDFITQTDEASNHTIEYVKGFVNMHTRCTFHCKVCDYVWETLPYVIKQGHRCPACCKKSMEKPILEAFKKKGIHPLYDTALKGSNYNGSSHPLRVDFIIETLEGKLAIESDGIQHFKQSRGGLKALKFQQEKDRHKDKILKERGYILIRVTSSPTKEWGFKNHITLADLLYLIEIGIDKNGNINLDVFRPYDFNRE